MIYHCYGGAHSSVGAAALRVGAVGAAARANDIMALPLFDAQNPFEHGIVRLVGNDAAGAPVYVLARRRSSRAVASALSRLAPLFGAPRPVVIDTMGGVNAGMRLGGFLSRSVGWPRLARRLAAAATCRAMPTLVRLAGLPARAPDASGASGGEGARSGVVVVYISGAWPVARPAQPGAPPARPVARPARPGAPPARLRRGEALDCGPDAMGRRVALFAASARDAVLVERAVRSYLAASGIAAPVAFVSAVDAGILL